MAFLYLLYFTSGAYVDFRKSKGEEDVSLLLTFVSFWFFPVGVWLMQPKLNEWQPDNEGISLKEIIAELKMKIVEKQQKER